MAEPLPAYRGDEPYVFVSYSHADEKAVYSEIRWLQDQGINVWYDTTGIGPGSEWSEEIARSIKGASHFLYFITPGSVASEHCRRELSFAQAESRPVLAVHFEDTPVPDGLRLSLDNRQAIPRYRLSTDAYRSALLRSLAEDSLAAQIVPKTVGGRRRYLGFAAVFLLVSFVAWIGSREFQRGVEEPTVAIAPFKAIGDDNALERFAEGTTLDVRSALSETSVSLVESEADYLVNGYVRRLGGQMQVTVEFQRTRDQKTMWSDQLQESGDTFTRAPYVAGRIEGLLKQIVFVRGTATSSEEARDHLLAARVEFVEFASGAGGDLDLFLSSVNRALDFDPDYVPALADLVNAYTGRLWGKISTKQAIPLAHATQRRVLNINPDATYFLGKINLTMDLDYDSAIRNYDHMLTRPSFEWAYGAAEQEICLTYYARGDLDKALEHCERSLLRGADALQSITYFTMGVIHHTARRYKSAVQAFDKSSAAFGHDDVPLLIRSAKASYALNDRTAAKQKLDQAWDLAGESKPEFFPGLLALMRYPGRAEPILAQTKMKFPEDGPSEWASMVITESFWGHFHLRNFEDAIDWIDRGIANRNIWLIGLLKNSREIDEIRDHPRFRAAMQDLAEIEAQGTPTSSIATECYHGPNARPPKPVSCARFKD